MREPEGIDMERWKEVSILHQIAQLHLISTGLSERSLHDFVLAID